MKEIGIIGSGFSSLSAACYLSKAGYKVSVFEKNRELGGRARQYKVDGFTFDMGPSWYWMPDVMEKFFNDFGKSTADYFQLDKLSPAYRVYFEDKSFIDIEDEPEKIINKFESIEKGAGKHLDAFLEKAGFNYKVAIDKMVYKPGLSPLELVSKETAFRVGQFFTPITKNIRKNFKDKRLQQILEFPVLFLGAKPSDTPAFYSFMNFADFGKGTWYPKGGMHELVKAMVSLAKEMNVSFHTDCNVESINTSNNEATSITVNGEEHKFDIILSGADYHHSETLLNKNQRQYSEEYWKKRTFAPSSLLFYVGFDKKLEKQMHHTLCFDADFNKHAKEIYDSPQWPDNPLFYANFTSLSDDSVAPEGKDCGFFLIPIAPDLSDDEETRMKYFDLILDRLEELSGEKLKEHATLFRSFCVNDFKKDYNSYGGNAYGMANTLRQTAFLRPKLKSKKVKNLFFTGQLTVPGPGVPPAIISGKLTSELIQKEL